MKQRLLRREDVLKVLNVCQQQAPVTVMGEQGRAIYGSQMFTLMVDYDLFVAELNEWVYKVDWEVD